MANEQQRIDLRKKVGIVLEKRQLFNLVCKIGTVIDVSGSTSPLFKTHYGPSSMQQAISRVFAIADQVDDNHTCDSWIFADFALEMPGITPDNVDTYASKMIANSTDNKVKQVLWEGTKCVPFIKQVVDFYTGTAEEAPESSGVLSKLKNMFGKAKTVVQSRLSAEENLPSFVTVFTDGENSDKASTRTWLADAKNDNIFWQFIGVGLESFGFLKEMAATHPHVGFIDIKELDNISDDDLYTKVISEKFATWIKTNAPQAMSATPA